MIWRSWIWCNTLFLSISPPSLTPEDFVRLKSQWTGGGCVLSVYDSALADAWVIQNYDDKFLINLRAKKIGGPVASMLSVDVQALTIFGSMSPQIIKTADELAQLSQFPVIIRPATEDPSVYFK
jgi:hypothetical protein